MSQSTDSLVSRRHGGAADSGVRVGLVTVTRRGLGGGRTPGRGRPAARARAPGKDTSVTVGHDDWHGRFYQYCTSGSADIVD